MSRADFTVETGYTAEYTDNTALTADHEVPEWVQSPSVTVGANHESDALTLLANYNATRNFHQQDTFNDQTNTVGTGHLTWRAVPQRLTFDLSNASTLTTINSQEANAQDNQQVVSTTTAGATLTVDSFSNHSIQLHYDYSTVNAGQTNTDSKRQTVNAAYIIPLEQRERVQFNATFDDVNYDSSQNPDYTSQSGNVQFVRNSDVVDLDTSIGFTMFDRRQGADNTSGTVGDIRLTWHITDTTNANASFVRSIEDQSANLTTGIPTYGQEITDNSYLTTPYTMDATTVGIGTQFGPNQLNMTAYWNSLDYDGSPNDQDTYGTTLGLSRAMWPTLTGRMYVNYSYTDYVDQDQKNHYFSSGLRFEWTRWRDLTVSFGTTYVKQTSDVHENEYNEWAGSLGLSYMLIGRRQR